MEIACLLTIAKQAVTLSEVISTVYNITCGVDDLVVGDCNVTEALYVDNRLQQGYIYRSSNLENVFHELLISDHSKHIWHQV